ncbi:hypothetical protein KJA15_00275 [Patescibacteria group bacterium]|nr:hypothetical protein [Patescibacteria group bacterium]
MIVLFVLIFGGVFYLIEQVKFPQKKEIVEDQGPPEVFSLGAVIAEINIEDNYLIVKPPKEEKKIKVNLSRDTEIVQLKFPFDPKNPPLEATFTPEKIPITIKDLKSGDFLLIKSKTNIAGKSELNDVSKIESLP